MKLLLIKCGICDNWHSPQSNAWSTLNICGVCGAVKVPPIIAKSGYVNRQGVEMVRAIPRPMEQRINMQYSERG